MGRRRLATLAALALVGGAIVAPGCRSPTDVRLVVRSIDVPCPALLAGGEIEMAPDTFSAPDSFMAPDTFSAPETGGKDGTVQTLDGGLDEAGI